MTVEAALVIAALSTFGVAAFALYFAVTTSKILKETKVVLEETQAVTKDLKATQESVEKVSTDLRQVMGDLTYIKSLELGDLNTEYVRVKGIMKDRYRPDTGIEYGQK